jgi:ABC-type transport system substrate-binding protein
VAGGGDALGPRSSAARRFGAARGDRPVRWSRPTLPATDLLRLRTASGPLADARLRRAVVLALDRDAMAAVLDDVPATHALPPGVAGSLPVTPRRRDVARARALVGRRHVTLVLAGCRGRPACPALGSLVRAALRRAGIAVHVRPGARDADLSFRHIAMSAPDPLGFLAAAGGPHAPSPRPGPARATAIARRIDARLVSTHEVFAIGTAAVGELATARLGCRAQLPLSFGPHLTSLCPADGSAPKPTP